MTTPGRQIIAGIAGILLLMGCAGAPIGQTVCRHNVLRDLAFLQEKNYEARVAIYRVDLVTSHAQAQALKDGEWYWVDNYYGDVYLSKAPQAKVTGWTFYYSPEEYKEELDQNFQNLRGRVH